MDQKLRLHQQLRTAMNQEILDREKLHKAKIAAFNSAQAMRRATGARVPTAPLALLAHGDSWFDYPLAGNDLSFQHTDLVVQLQSLGNISPYILNVSQWGDATTTEMSLRKQQLMIQALQDPTNWFASGKPDAILFSGGGNDVAGDQFCIFLDYAGTTTLGLNAARFQGVLAMVEASYLDLFAFRDRYAANVPIFGHCYDFPIPNGIHPVCAGPWLKPSLDFSGYNIPQGTAIIREGLTEFRTLLVKLATPANNFFLVDTQGTLRAGDWANELHPYPQGFRTIAGKFVDALRGHFSGRI
jgi:hypothetical protein